MDTASRTPRKKSFSQSGAGRVEVPPLPELASDGIDVGGVARRTKTETNLRGS